MSWIFLAQWSSAPVKFTFYETSKQISAQKLSKKKRQSAGKFDSARSSENVESRYDNIKRKSFRANSSKNFNFVFLPSVLLTMTVYTQTTATPFWQHQLKLSASWQKNSYTLVQISRNFTLNILIPLLTSAADKCVFVHNPVQK